VLAHGDKPEWYGLPREPKIPMAVSFWMSVLRPLGFVAMLGTAFAFLGHYMAVGPKKPKEGPSGGDDVSKTPPQA
jgi:hypothetical protein